MIAMFPGTRHPAACSDRGPAERRRLRVFFLLLLFLGVLSGGIVGSFDTAGRFAVVSDFFAFSAPPVGFLPALFQSVIWLLLLSFSATALIGVFLSPFVLFARCFVFSFGVSSLFSAASYRGLFQAFLLCGIPAALTLPFLLSTAEDSFLLSSEIFSLLVLRRRSARSRASAAGHFLLALLSAAVSAAYSCFLLPLLIS